MSIPVAILAGGIAGGVLLLALVLMVLLRARRASVPPSSVYQGYPAPQVYTAYRPPVSPTPVAVAQYAYGNANANNINNMNALANSAQDKGIYDNAPKAALAPINQAALRFNPATGNFE